MPWRIVFGGTQDKLSNGIAELESIADFVEAAGYDDGRITIDPSVVRGLEYYTGPVFEAELTFEIKDEKGRPVRFGSVGGGGRYDGLIGRFRGEPVPATGFSIGVSRLQAALSALGKLEGEAQTGPVVVTVFDRDRLADYQRMVQRLRDADIRAELYLGPGKMGPQMKSPTSATRPEKRGEERGRRVDLRSKGAKATPQPESGRAPSPAPVGREKGERG